MGGPHAAQPRPVVSPVQPAQKLGADAPAQHAPPFQAQALAGDDQHDPQILRRRLIEESADGALGRRQRHAVKVERGLRHELAAPQGAGDVAVEIMIVQCQLWCCFPPPALRATSPV